MSEIDFDEKAFENPNYNAKFIDFLLHEALSVYPLMSAVLIQKFGLKHDWNNYLNSNYSAFLQSEENGRNHGEVIKFLAKNHLAKIMDAKNNINTYSNQTTEHRKRRNLKPIQDISDNESKNEEKMNAEQSVVSLDDWRLDQSVEVCIDKNKTLKLS